MTNEGRRDPRKPTVLQIRFKNATIAEFLEKHSRDISRGGIFIKMKTPFPTGTLIKFDIRLAKDSVIHGVGRVVWCRRRDESLNTPSGMGVKFIKLDDKSRILLDDVLASKDPREEADTPLFDDALPKPKAKVSGLPPKEGKSKGVGSKTGLPEPSGKSSKGVSFREDTRKVRFAALEATTTAPPPPPSLSDEGDEDEAETVVSDGKMMEEVLRMARQPSEDSSPPAESDPLLSGTKEEFLEDISYAISDVLEAPQSTKKPVPRVPSPNEPKVKVEPSLQTMPQLEETVQNKRGNSGLFLGIVAAAIVGGVVFFVLFLKSPESPPKEVSNLEPVESQHKSATTAAPATSLTERIENKEHQIQESAQPESVQQTPPGKTRTLKVETFPRDATVFIDGTLQPGTTPLKFSAITAEKPVEVTIHRFGFLDYTKTLEPEESEAYIKQDLQPAAFTIDISSQPAGAKIVIDSRGYGTTPRTLKPNRFSKTPEIRITKPGYATAIYNIIEADWAFDGKKYLLTIDAALEEGNGPASIRRSPSSSSTKSTPITLPLPVPPSPPTTNESDTTDETVSMTPHTPSEEAPGAGEETPPPPESSESSEPPSEPGEPSAEERPTVPLLITDEPHKTEEKPVPEEKPAPEEPTPSEDPVPDEKPAEKKPTAPKEESPPKSPPPPNAPSDGAPKTGKIDDNPF